MRHFQPLEVVDRGSETQPQVVENLNKNIGRIRVNPCAAYIPNQSHWYWST